jgi:ComF family protein
MINQASSDFRHFLLKNWHGFLSIIYPTSCQVCGRDLPEGIDHICAFCFTDLELTHFEKYKETNPAEELFWGRIALKHVFSLLYFKKEGATQELLHTIKYKNGKELAIHCGERMGKQWIKAHSDFSVDAIIPIPLHEKKAFKRGYNQSLLLAEGLQKHVSAPIHEAVIRMRHHQSQTKKNRFERQDNVASIFKAVPQFLENKKHVIIIDDVLTTGATLEAAAYAILEFNPSIEISLFTLAMAK